MGPGRSQQKRIGPVYLLPFPHPEGHDRETIPLYEGRGPADSIEIAKGIVMEAAAVTQDILYMDVTEDNNPRRSFDINMYRAGLRMEALYPLLMEMSDRYSVAGQQFKTFFETVKARRFGHLSGGTDREGRDFFTLHYGVEEH